VLLDGAEETRAVRDRAEAAGVEAVDYDGGLLVRDPWGIGGAFTTEPGG